MSKKIVAGLIGAVLVFGASFSTVGAQAVSGLSFAQLIEVLISTGLIPQEKAASARAMVNLQAQSAAGVSATTATVNAPSGAVTSTVSLPAVLYHSADTNKDWKISESELNRVTDLYNYRYSTSTGTVRSGEYSVSTSIPNIDGYKAGPGPQTGTHHSADLNKNWRIDLNELTRVISLKNAAGGYKVQAGTEDGFAAIVSAAATQLSVDLKINGSDSVTVTNNTAVKVSWTSTGSQSCTASGSMFSLSNGGLWGNNGLLGSSGDVTLIAATSGNLPSTLSVGIQCRSANGNTTTDTVPVKIMSTVQPVTTPTTPAVPVTPVAPTTPVTQPNLTNGITFSSVPSSVTAGATFNVVVINAGTKPWGPWHNIALSSSDLSTNFQMLNLGTTVVGASKTVTFTAPTTSGTYKIRSLEHNVAWFGDVKTITVVGAQTQPQVQPITGTLSVSSTCVVPGTNVVATATVTGDGITSKNLEKDTNADGVFGTAATWGSGVGTHSFTTAEGGAYSGRIDLKLVVNGSVRDSKSVTVSTACGPQTQNYSQSCAGTQPSGAGVVKGYESYTTGYGTNQWTFTTASAPSACQWTCASGYGLSGNSCQQNPATPAPITYQSCSGTEPSGSYVTKGNGSYQTGYGTTNWTFVTGTPAACQFACANGATWNGAACTLPTPTVSLMADTSCAAPGSTITVTSYVSGSPIESNYIERDTPAENSQVGDGIFGGKADYGTSGGSHSYSQVTEREGYYDFRAVVNNSITSSVRVYSGASCGDTSMIEGSSNLGSAVVGFDSLVKLLQLLK